MILMEGLDTIVIQTMDTNPLPAPLKPILRTSQYSTECYASNGSYSISTRTEPLQAPLVDNIPSIRDNSKKGVYDGARRSNDKVRKPYGPSNPYGTGTGFLFWF